MDEKQDGRLTLRGLEIFVAVVREGSLGGGARFLGAAASTVSQQISGLEDALGVRLIDRRARPMAITPAGRLFLARAEAVLDQLGEGRAELAALDLSAIRSLSLATVEDLDAEVLPELLLRLAAAFPQCEFSARSATSHENLAALEGRTADLVVVAGDPPRDDWVEAHQIVRDPLVLLTAGGVLGQGADPLAVLATTPFVRFDRRQRIAQQVEAHLRRAGLSPPRRFEVQTNTALIGLVSLAKGWAVSTAMGVLSVGRADRPVEIHPLPFAAGARTLWVCARRAELGKLPHAVSEVLRGVAQDRLIAPGRERMPWIADAFRVLRD